MKGFVYILSNPSMPGLIKVGMTARSVEGRAGELYQTGVPTPFVVEHSVLSPDCARLEAEVHDTLADLRVGQGREFFRCEAHRAMGCLDAALYEQVSGFVREYMESHTLVYEPYFVDPSDLYSACDGTDALPHELAQAIGLIEKGAIQDAVSLRRERSKAWQALRSANLVQVQ